MSRLLNLWYQQKIIVARHQSLNKVSQLLFEPNSNSTLRFDKSIFFLPSVRPETAVFLYYRFSIFPKDPFEVATSVVVSV